MSAKFHLVEAPLMSTQQPKVALVERMANVLLMQGAYGSREDAVQALFWAGDFRSFEVARFVDDARQVAVQEMVAREMGES